MQIYTNAGDKLCITPTAAMQISTNQFLTTVAAFFLLQENKIHSLVIMDKAVSSSVSRNFFISSFFMYNLLINSDFKVQSYNDKCQVF